MGLPRFMSFDPFLTFAEGERGFQEKIFLRADGTPTETWYGKDRDGKGYLSSLWRIGRDAYATIAEKTGEQPTAVFLEEAAEGIKEQEMDLVPLLQALITDGKLDILEDRDSLSPVVDLRAAMEDAEDGWVTRVWMGFVMPAAISGDIKPAQLCDFEGALLTLALINLDDCIIADQIGRGADSAFDLVTANIESAKLYKQAINSAKEAVSAIGRRSANARHKDTNAQKAEALAEWDRIGHTFSGMAAFARHKHKNYQVTDRTLCGWVRDHRKTKA